MILNYFVAVQLLPELFQVLYQIFDFISNQQRIIISFLRNISLETFLAYTPGDISLTAPLFYYVTVESQKKIIFYLHIPAKCGITYMFVLGR